MESNPAIKNIEQKMTDFLLGLNIPPEKIKEKGVHGAVMSLSQADFERLMRSPNFSPEEIASIRKQLSR